MEKAISVEERIRRAEELYYKRKVQGIRMSSGNVNNKNRSGFSLFKRLIIKILICLLIYSVFIIIKNSNHVFSASIIDKVQKVLKHDINIEKEFKKLNGMYKNKINKLNQEEDDKEKQELDNFENNEILNQDNNEMLDQENNISSNENQEELGMGGASDSDQINDNTRKLDSKIITKGQMEIDADYIKQKYNLIIPAKGVITSRFGPREKTEIVSANHEGIDIGASRGTPIYASIQGEVIEAADYGDYGKHIKIKTDDIIILYAHCNNISVKKGEFVEQGQQIGEIGSTR